MIKNRVEAKKLNKAYYKKYVEVQWEPYCPYCRDPIEELPYALQWECSCRVWQHTDNHELSPELKQEDSK